MIIELHDGFKQPQKINCTRILIKDNFGNPVGVAVETGPNLLTIAHVNEEPQFFNLLKVLGVDNV